MPHPKSSWSLSLGPFSTPSPTSVSDNRHVPDVEATNLAYSHSWLLLWFESKMSPTGSCLNAWSPAAATLGDCSVEPLEGEDWLMETENEERAMDGHIHLGVPGNIFCFLDLHNVRSPSTVMDGNSLNLWAQIDLIPLGPFCWVIWSQ